MILSTKAETLSRLAGKLNRCQVPKLLYFKVGEWSRERAQRDRLVSRVAAAFSGPVAVRSSAIDEDSAVGSLAGRYRSRLGVPTERRALERAIDDVAASLGEHANHQILVQEMVENAVVGGVVLTRDLNTGGPYYVVNYDDVSGRADLITSGGDRQKTVLVHRETELEPSWLADLLAMARELESIFPDQPLDIEFALSRDGTFHLLQARPLAARANWAGVCDACVGKTLRRAEKSFAAINRVRPETAGQSTVLGLMPDWNPAELIGVQPSPLALSIFRFLISDSAWWRARASMGYRAVSLPLLRPLAGRPYVDVRNSFNSLLPAGLPAAIETSLVEAWLDRLRTHPELHDKVEFEIAQTVLDLDFFGAFESRYREVLDRRELLLYSRRLRRLTCRNVSLDANSSLARAVARTAGLKLQSGARTDGGLEEGLRLLDLCRLCGGFPFAIVARHAFIAEALLRSAVKTGVWDEADLAALRHGIGSVAGRIRCDFRRVRRGDLPASRFLADYGHLRPGIFDICSPRYDQRTDLFSGVIAEVQQDRSQPKVDCPRPSPPRLDSALAAAGLSFTGRELLAYAREAIRQREEVKFQWSRPLSDALEKFALWGEAVGLSREDLAFLTLPELRRHAHSDPGVWQEIVAERRERARRRSGLRLGPLVRQARDLRVVELSASCANFVTLKNVVGPPQRLGARSPLGLALEGKIACVESADPGFDWLFSRGVLGLVTKFGGSNSHMAIRCAELSVPAAIGVGEGLFDRLLESSSVELRCRERLVRPIGV